MGRRYILPEEDIKAVEEARLKLHELIESNGWDKNQILVTELMQVTVPMWKISHRKYNEEK